MILAKRRSKWSFATSGSGGLAIEFFAAEGGKLFLADPQRKMQVFTYGGAGVGFGAGFKLPKVGKLPVGAAIAPKEFPNRGQVRLLDTYPGEELTRSDITGVCMLATIGGGLGAGASITGLLFGMDPMFLAATIVSSPCIPLAIMAETQLLQSATGILIMGGLNVGVQAGGGIAAMLGAIA